MREQLTSARSLKFISIAEAVLITYLLVLFIYLLTNVGQNPDVTITPPITTSVPTITSPSATTTPATGSQQPSSRPVYNNI